MEGRTTSNLLKKFSEVVSKPIALDFLNRKSKHFWLIRGLSLGFGGCAIALSIIGIKIINQLPNSVDDLSSYARSETLTIKSKDKIVLQEIGDVTHEKLNIDRIPKILQQAFLASEDRRFWEHAGVDFQGIVRAVFSNFRAGGVIQGGSTITQQLARIAFLNQERSIDRKLKEMIIAHSIEERFNKKQILENYLNLVYLGSGAYGVGDAAWLYFSKSVDRLTV
ncbi:MAG: transglycosylase domain-containing protein, partial [Xenococcaceae cyanobacterium]